MNSKKLFQLYTCVWCVSLCVLFTFLWKMSDDEHIVNYTGLVRGGTQRVIVNEFHGVNDDEMIQFIDGIVEELKATNNNILFFQLPDTSYQSQLEEITVYWTEIKREISLLRQGEDVEENLYSLSQQHFETADNLVSYVELQSTVELHKFVTFFCLFLILAIFFIAYSYFRNKKIVYNAQKIDTLTGLMSRHGFLNSAEEILSTSPDEKFVIIEFDINNFKLINNKYGYEKGDAILAEIGMSLNKCCEQNLLSSRIGSDTFVLLSKFDDTIADTFPAYMTNIVNNFEDRHYFDEIHFSYGLYKIQDNREAINLIIDKANLARIEAKKSSNSNAIIYDEKFLHALQKHHYYTDSMQRAIDEHELQAYLQPQMNLSTMKIAEAESLVRWQLPDGSFAFPDEFIPIYEKNGSIYKLDFYMLTQVCEFLRDLPTEHEDFVIAVNFSRHSVCHTRFYEDFISLVKTYGIKHSRIKIEVTETSLNKVGDQALKVLLMLKNDGFLIAMDDFGAGYSSLSFLSKLPVDTIKLDRQFLWGIDKSERMKDIIESTIKMAHKIGISVTCEGVETKEHLDFIKGVNCNFAQGYYFSKPIPKDEFLEKYLS